MESASYFTGRLLCFLLSEIDRQFSVVVSEQVVSLMRNLMTALVLVGLAGGIGQWVVAGAPWIAKDKPDSALTVPTRTGVITQSAKRLTPSHSPDNADRGASSDGQSVARPRPGSESAQNPVVVPRQERGNELEPAPLMATNESDAYSVVGRPFPISKSVANSADSCKRDLAISRNAPCGELFRLLSVFAEEPRDPDWADDIETRLYELVMKDADRFVVRAIECRTSLCVAEVASIYGAFHFIRKIYLDEDHKDENLRKKVWTGKGWLGYEPDASGAEVTVTLFVIERL